MMLAPTALPAQSLSQDFQRQPYRGAHLLLQGTRLQQLRLFLSSRP